MNMIALVVTLIAVAVATAAAAADGALLGEDPDPEPSQSLAVRRREHAHRALALARTLALLVGGAGAALALEIERSDGARGAVLALAAALTVALVVEGIARAIGFACSKSISRALRGFTRVTATVLAPVLRAGEMLDSGFELVVPAPSIEERQEQREEAEEQFRQVVAAEADVSRDERVLLHRVFSLGDTAVRSIMVPRVDIVAIDRATPWSEVVDRVLSSEHARFPVYDDTLDNVIGILYAKDLLPFVIDEDEPMLGWQALIRGASFIPTSKLIDEQLREFKATHTHIAIVSDEFGGTAGLVTIEDVLEEIVGEIHDEYDVEEPDVVREGGTRFWVSGGLALDELSELLAQDFAQDDVTTVGGLVYEAFGHVPRAGESIIIGAYKLVVERVRGRRISRVYFERIAPHNAEVTD